MMKLCSAKTRSGLDLVRQLGVPRKNSVGPGSCPSTGRWTEPVVVMKLSENRLCHDVHVFWQLVAV